MTPTTQRLVWSRYIPMHPVGLDVSSERLAFTDVRPAHDWPGTDGVVESFIRLAAATADEMGGFLRHYGVPEVCMHGLPDCHEGRRPDGWNPGKDWRCPWARDGDLRAIRVDDLRTVARAFGAACELATALSARIPGSGTAWADLARMYGGFYAPRDVDWMQGRARLAEWCTRLLRDSGVGPLARWDVGRPLSVTQEADGLLGVLAILLIREVGQGDAYRCDVCGAPVPRVRPPREDERVYCDKPSCRREQARRNQAAWRARKRAATQDA